MENEIQLLFIFTSLNRIKKKEIYPDSTYHFINLFISSQSATRARRSAGVEGEIESVERVEEISLIDFEWILRAGRFAMRRSFSSLSLSSIDDILIKKNIEFHFHFNSKSIRKRLRAT